MEKVFEKSTKDQLNPHKGLKFLSALGMVLPVFMGSVQSVFADGHHYIQVDNIPGVVPIDQNSFGGRQGQIASVYSVHGGFWDDRHQGIHGKVDGKDMRFYCLEPEKVTPGQGSTSKYKKQQAKVGVKKVLMVGFGANKIDLAQVTKIIMIRPFPRVYPSIRDLYCCRSLALDHSSLN